MAAPARTDSAAAFVARTFGHAFANPALLERALTHASRCGTNAAPEERLAQSNERMEFLGDAMLGAALCDLQYAANPGLDEGGLSRLKSNLASRQVLARIFDRIGLEAHARVGPTVAAGTWAVSVKANLVEAVLGAIYLDGGWQAVRSAVALLYAEEASRSDAGDTDPRMQLQAWAHARRLPLPAYETRRDGGSEHEPVYLAIVTVDGRSSEGRGGGRRRAEAMAAQAWLHAVGPAR